jgi:Major tropism determinant N-terminal domain
MSLRIRRGTDAQRQGIAFDLGEPVWTTDLLQLWIGDGITTGGKSIAQGIAGPGLSYNPSTGKLETSNATLTTDAITEGTSHLYFTTSRATSAAAAALINGSHTGITYAYVSGAINSTAYTLETDSTPTLNGDLNLNENNITGTGEIDLNVLITSAGSSSVSLGSVTHPVTVYSYSESTEDIAQFNCISPGTSFPFFTINAYKNSFSSPVNFSGGDYVSSLRFQAWNQSLDTFQNIGSIYSLFDSSANFTTNFPAAKLIFTVGNNSSNPTGSMMEFDNSGTLSVTGAVVVGSFEGSGAYPTSPSQGTIIFDSNTNHFFGYNGTTWKQLDN